jgi:YggT family protein
MIAILATTAREHVADYVAAVFFVYSAIIIAYILSGLYFAVGGRLPYARWSSAILSFLRDTSEPFLAIFRRVIPMAGPLDLSPILALVVLGIGGGIVVSLIRG